MASDLTQSGVGEPAVYANAVAPSDLQDLPIASRALYIGAAGNLAVQMLGGGSVVFAGIPAGLILPIRARRVLSTGTTATLILALY